MEGYFSPSLFITMYSLYGCPEEFRDLLLGFFQGLTKRSKFFVIHVRA